MCLAIPGRVLKIEGRKATVDYPGEQRFAMIGADVPRVGEYVLVQMGIIVKILTESEAKVSIAAWTKTA